MQALIEKGHLGEKMIPLLKVKNSDVNEIQR